MDPNTSQSGGFGSGYTNETNYFLMQSQYYSADNKGYASLGISKTIYNGGAVQGSSYQSVYEYHQYSRSQSFNSHSTHAPPPPTYGQGQPFVPPPPPPPCCQGQPFVPHAPPPPPYGQGQPFVPQAPPPPPYGQGQPFVPHAPPPPCCQGQPFVPHAPPPPPYCQGQPFVPHVPPPDCSYKAPPSSCPQPYPNSTSQAHNQYQSMFEGNRGQPNPYGAPHPYPFDPPPAHALLDRAYNQYMYLTGGKGRPWGSGRRNMREECFVPFVPHAPPPPCCQGQPFVPHAPPPPCCQGQPFVPPYGQGQPFVPHAPPPPPCGQGQPFVAPPPPTYGQGQPFVPQPYPNNTPQAHNQYQSMFEGNRGQPNPYGAPHPYPFDPPPAHALLDRAYNQYMYLTGGKGRPWGSGRRNMRE